MNVTSSEKYVKVERRKIQTLNQSIPLMDCQTYHPLVSLFRACVVADVFTDPFPPRDRDGVSGSQHHPPAADRSQKKEKQPDGEMAGGNEISRVLNRIVL